MGKVARQSIISSFSAYLGVVIGYLNIVILMPKYFTPEQIGLFRTIIAIAMLLVPFAFFGSGSAIIKFHPKYRQKVPQLIGLLAISILIAFIIVLVVVLLFEDTIAKLFAENAPAVNDYFPLILSLLFLMVFYNFFQAISKSFQSIVIPNFLTDFVYKSMNSLIIIAVGLGIITFHQYLLGHVYLYVLLCAVLTIVVVRSFNISFSLSFLNDRKFIREILNFTSFSFLGSFGIILVFQIDQIMVSQMLGLEQNGIYTTALFMGLVIELPRKYVGQIMHPYISEDLHSQNLSKLNYGYKEASNILMWVGGTIFLMLTLNLENIYKIMPNGESYYQGYWVVYLVGLTKLLSMSFSLNGEIISISKFYKVNVILIFLLGLMTIVTNKLLIPIYGMEGAAMASLLTILVFSLIKYLILKINFVIDPFSSKSLIILFYLIPCYILVRLIPPIGGNVTDLMIRSLIIGIFSVAFVLIAHPSDELRRLILKITKIIK